MQIKGAKYGPYFVPDQDTLYAVQVMTQQLCNKMLITLRNLAGGGMLKLLSLIADFPNPELNKLIGLTKQSSAASSGEWAKCFKLAWDAVGSEFTSRHAQYEMFYVSETFVAKEHCFRTFD